MPELLRTNIAYKMRGPVGVTIRVAIKACDSATGVLRSPVLGLVELLLRKCGQKQAQAVQLFGIKSPLKIW